MSDGNQTFVIGATLVMGLATLAVISRPGGSITVSKTALAVTVNSAQ